MSVSPEILGARRLAWVFGVCALFLAGAWLRFHALGEIELFVDEGGHLLVPVDNDVRRVIDPIAEGKAGMLWFFQPAFNLSLDPLIAARAMVGLCGLLSAGAIGATLWLLFGRTAAAIGLALWLLLPFTVFHERLALFDPTIATLMAGGIAVLTHGNRPGKRSLQALVWTSIGSFIAGTAAVQKISALISAPWLLLVFVAIHRRYSRSIPISRLFVAIGAFMCPALCLWLAAPGLGDRILMSNAAQAAAEPFSFLSWYAGYGGWPLGVLVVYASFVVWRRREGAIACFGFAALLALVMSSIVYRQPYARYVHPDHVPLVIFIAAAIAADPRRIGFMLCAIACLRWGQCDVQIITDPRTAPLPASEIEQYVTGFWSGHGSSRMIRFIEQHTPCVTFVHRYSRPGSYALLLAARRNPSITAVPLSIELPGAVDAAKAAARYHGGAKGTATYLIAEGSPPIEPAILTAAGIPNRVVFENIKHGKTELTQVLECDFTRLP